MMNKGITSLLIFFGVLHLVFANPYDTWDEGWKKAEEKDGIRVYTRSVDGFEVKEFKAITTVEASLSSIVAVFMDVPAYPEWLFNCIEAEMLEQRVRESFKYYLETKTPFPFDHRDMVQQLSIQQPPDTNIVKILLKNLPTFTDTKEGVVRMQVANGCWLLKPLTGNQIELTFQYRFDPGGNIPAWIVNMFLVKSPMETMKNLREQLKKEKYQKASISWIEKK